MRSPSDATVNRRRRALEQPAAADDRMPIPIRPTSVRPIVQCSKKNPSTASANRSRRHDRKPLLVPESPEHDAVGAGASTRVERKLACTRLGESASHHGPGGATPIHTARDRARTIERKRKQERGRPGNASRGGAELRCSTPWYNPIYFARHRNRNPCGTSATRRPASARRPRTVESGGFAARYRRRAVKRPSSPVSCPRQAACVRLRPRSIHPEPPARARQATILAAMRAAATRRSLRQSTRAGARPSSARHVKDLADDKLPRRAQRFRPRAASPQRRLEREASAPPP